MRGRDQGVWHHDRTGPGGSRCPTGETLSVIGPSGCGKSTLLRVIAGLTAIDAGTVTLAGREVSGPTVFVPAERRGVGIVFQDLALFPHLSVADNIGFGLRFGNGRVRARADGRDRVGQMLDLMDLADKAARFPHELSGGEQQRVAIGRALALDPKLVLLDEPFSHLDRGLAVTVRNEAMQMLHRAGATVVLVTTTRGRRWPGRPGRGHAGGPDRAARLTASSSTSRQQFAAAFLGEADFLVGRREGAVAHTVLGAVPVGAGRNGPVRVLLRPHHVTAVAAASDTSARGAPGTVEHVEFRGGVSLHVLRLVSGESVRALLPYSAAFTAGDPVVVPVPRGVILTAFDA